MENVIEKILFNLDEIQFIKSKLDKIEFSRSTVNKNSTKSIVSNYRKSLQSSLKLEDELKQILLNRLKHFGIVKLPEYGDILKYSIGDEFRKHIDNGYPHNNRYKTCIIQLSNPEDYEGGELEIHGSHKIVSNKSMGNVILFDSSLLHSANIITSGTRYCMVIWFEKKHFGLSNTFI